MKSKKNKNMFNDFFAGCNEKIGLLNNSKVFAGIMILILNIASKFTTIQLSKSIEAYLKYTFSKQVIVFAMAWMGTRDIYIALVITIIFTICTEYLFNEESRFCVLPESFTDYHLNLMNTKENMTSKNEITDKDIEKTKEILDKLGVKLTADIAR